jgi:hypothetical protein
MHSGKVRLPDAAVRQSSLPGWTRWKGAILQGEVLRSMPGEIVLAYTIDRNVAETFRRLHAGASCIVHPFIETGRTTIFVFR